MPYIVARDRQKEAAQNSALSRIESARRDVESLLRDVQRLISQLDYAVGGAPSGIDRTLIGQCRRAESELSSALRQLNTAAGRVGALDPIDAKWVPEGNGNGG